MKSEWFVSPRKLSRARVDQLLTQDQLSKKSGVSLRSIQGYERKEQRVRIETLNLLAKTLEIQVREIATLRTAGGDDSHFPSPPTKPGIPAPAVLLPRTQLETLVDLERAAGIAPAPVERPGGTFEPLTAKRLQDVLTAYALHEGARFCLSGRVDGMRGLPPDEATLLGSRGGVAARFHILKEVVPGKPVGVTVHTARKEETERLQQRYGADVMLFLRVLVVPGEPRDDGPGFSSFITRIAAKRPWTFVVDEVAEAERSASVGDAAGVRRGAKTKRKRKS
jgi:transcriptional regulator with XRE-family HTH domain